MTIPLSLGLAGGFQVGSDSGSPVTDAYDGPFEFTGKLYNVVIDVSGELLKDDAATMNKLLARQ